MRKKAWMYLSLGCLAASVLSLFLNILSYTNEEGIKTSYNIINFVFNPIEFGQNVLMEYTGNLFRYVTLDVAIVVIVIFSFVGIAALVCSVAGVLRMGKQRPTRLSFLLALIGLIGTSLPAVTILIILMLSNNYFLGEISAGLYVVITPIAMICSIISVSLKHNRNKAQMEARKRVEEYLRVAGDL